MNNNATTPAVIAESILPAYAEYSRLDAEIKRLTKLRDAEKAKVFAWQQELGSKNAEGHGFSSVIVDAYVRETLLKEEIEKRFGPIPPECIKRTTVKEALKISGHLLVEG